VPQAAGDGGEDRSGVEELRQNAAAARRLQETYNQLPVERVILYDQASCSSVANPS